MMFGMTRATKHLSDGRISQHVRGQHSFVDLPEEFAFWNIVMNMQCVFAATALCFLAAILTVSSLQANNLISPLAVGNSPVVASMGGERVFASAMTTDVSGNTDGGAFHVGSDVDRTVTTASADMSALVAIYPLNRFWGQSFAFEVMPLNVLWGTDRFAMVASFNGNHFSASTSTESFSTSLNPFIDRLTGRMFIAKHISHFKSLASGELLEPLPGNAEGNQQRSRGYTPGTFRDYLSRTVGLITGYSARVRKFHSGHDIVRTFEKSRDKFVNDTQDPKIGLTEVLRPLVAKAASANRMNCGKPDRVVSRAIRSQAKTTVLEGSSTTGAVQSA